MKYAFEPYVLLGNTVGQVERECVCVRENETETVCECVFVHLHTCLCVEAMGGAVGITGKNPAG